MSIVVSIMDRAGFNANTDIIVLVDGARKRLMWIPRDLWCMHTLGDRINVAFQAGGHARLMAALAEHGWQVEGSLCLSRDASEAALATARVLMPVPVRMVFAYPLQPTEPIENGAKQIEFNPPAEILVGERLHQWIGARGDSDLHRIERQKLLLRRLLDQKFDFTSALARPEWIDASDPQVFDELAAVTSDWEFCTASGFVDQLLDGKFVLVPRAQYPILKPVTPITTQQRIERLVAIMTKLDVAHNPHYQPRRQYGPFPGGTYCNIFAADCINNYFVTNGTVYQFSEEGQPAHRLPRLRYAGLLLDGYGLPPLSPEGRWLSVVHQVEWLDGTLAMTGPSARDRGWSQVDVGEAAQAAEAGYLVVAATAQDSKEHIAVLRPTAQVGKTAGELLVAQSGTIAADSIPLIQGFGTTDVAFYRHHPPDYTNLRQAVHEYIGGNHVVISGINIAYALVDVRSGQLVNANGFMPQPALSVFKPVLAACYFWLAENGYLVEQEAHHRQLALMLSFAWRGNHAASQIFDAIGGIANFNDWMLDQGFSPRYNHITDWRYGLPHAASSDAEAILATPTDPQSTLLDENREMATSLDNKIMPAELAHFLARVYRGEILNAAHTAQWLDLMRVEKKSSALYGGLPDDEAFSVYLKHGLMAQREAGTTGGTLHRHYETSLVHSAHGTFALCIFVKHPSPFTAQTVIHNLAAITYAHYKEAQLAHTRSAA